MYDSLILSWKDLYRVEWYSNTPKDWDAAFAVCVDPSKVKTGAAGTGFGAFCPVFDDPWAGVRPPSTCVFVPTTAAAPPGAKETVVP